MERPTSHEQPGVIDDTTARIIASEWHGGQASAMYSFVSTGRIDLDGLQAELTHDLTDDRTPLEERERLYALAEYFDRHGERGVVQGWHESTKWDGGAS